MRKGLMCALLLAMPIAVEAGVYTCEKNGRKTYQSTPCKSGDRPTEIKPINAVSTPELDSETALKRRQQIDEERRRSQEVLNERSEQVRMQREKREAIRRGKVLSGMSHADVLSAWGQPDSRSSSMEGGHAMERWSYGGRYRKEIKRVYFKDGEVISVTE